MTSSDQNIRRVFAEGFCARDIAQPLPSFDVETAVDRASTIMKRQGFRVAAVRTDGIVSGYVSIDALHGQQCGDCQRHLTERQLVSDMLPLAEVVLCLNAEPYCFVVAWGQPCAFIERLDLQKPPGRMWLFGMVTLIETRFSRLIERHCEEGEWVACLTPGRLQKAEALQATRLGLGQRVGLLSCLQFADLSQVVARLEKLRMFTRFESKRQIEHVGRQLEKLRNNLAHSQEIIEGDWETIVSLASNLSTILDGPPQGAFQSNIAEA